MPGHVDPAWLCVGRVNKPHGIKGEVFVSSLTDHPGSVYVPGVVVRGGDADGAAPDPTRDPLEIETVRPYKQGFLVRFAGYDDRDDVEALRGLYLMRPVEELEPLADDEVYYHQLEGMKVETAQGEPVGVVRGVYELHPNDLLDVRTPTGSILIPYVATVVTEVHRDEGRLVVDPPEGLLDL